MKKLCLVVVLGLALLVPAVSSAGSTAYAPKNCTKPAIEPKTIYIACGDGNFFIKVKHWSFFNGREAGGTGKALANDCMPDCADGNFHSYDVKIHLTKVKTTTCGGERVPLFQKIEVKFKGSRPSGLSADEKFDLFCSP
jgi:hypothetical protein